MPPIFQSLDHVNFMTLCMQWQLSNLMLLSAGVSESIIMGIPFSTGGTGMTQLRYTPDVHAAPIQRPDPVLG